MVDKKETPFYIIHHRGQPNRAQLPDGTWVERQISIFVQEFGGLVMCAPYDDHFIYEIPKSVIRLYPGPAHRCTCGSHAIFSGPSGYLLDASPSGKMFLCAAHANTGRHANGGQRWI